MATTMVRKQIYIQKRMDILLKKLSKARGLSESEIIRQAIERELSGSNQVQTRHLSALDEFIRVALESRKKGIKGEPYRWNREEIYSERQNRWIRDHEQE